MTITLLHPSRGRAEQAKQVRNRWIKKASGVYEIEHILSLDMSDPTLLNYTNTFNGKEFNTKVVINDNAHVVDATNVAAKKASGGILIYLSDDFDAPDNWDRLIIASMLKHFKSSELLTAPWLLKVDDMLQPMWKDVLTIPIMSAGLYKNLGYFWHPGYRSMFVDQDLYHTVNNMRVMFVDESLKFEHKHPSVGKAANDDTYKRSAANWTQGQALYNRRKKLNFPR